MAMALRRLEKFGSLKKWPVVDQVAATSVGLIGGVPMLDLCYQEDSAADVDMNVVMTGSGKFVELQATAEKTPFSDGEQQQMVSLAKQGITELLTLQKSLAG
jgi:ribonuclease PH